MKKVLITTLAIMAAAGAAFGWGKLVSSFRCPAGYIDPLGVSCYGSTRVWISTAQPDRIFECTPSGSVIRSFAGRTDGTNGIAVGNMAGTVFFWEVSWRTTSIYRRRATSGSTVRSWSTPRNGPVGAGFRQAGGAYYVYHTDLLAKRLYRMSAAYGQLQASYPLAFEPGDCAYGAGYLWITDPDSYAVWKCGENGVKYDVFSTVVWGRPYGIGYSGGYVWVGIGNPVNRILRFTATSGTDVAPASLGKVKAVFR